MQSQIPRENIFEHFFKLLPDDLRQYRAELEKNLRAALSAGLARMDLVTREEFDIQSALLSRTRALLDELEEKVRVLEKQLAKQQPGHTDTDPVKPKN